MSSTTEQTVDDIYRCTPRSAKAMIIDAIQGGVVPFVQSSPGIGKSSIMQNIARQFSLKLIDHRLSTSAPEDLSGLPEFYTDADGQRRARFVPFDIFPTDLTSVPEGYDGWMLFLDEMNSGTKMVQAASYKLILDCAAGQYPLNERLCITSAGNLSTDRAIVNALSTAMQSRVVHLEMRHDYNEWFEDVAVAEKYDPRIIAYHAFNKGKHLMDFQPDHQDKTFCCPRTWEFMNRLITGPDGPRQIVDEKIPLYAGTITSGVAIDFVQFTKVFDSLVKISDIEADPDNAPIPKDSPSKWMVMTHMAGHISKQNLGKLCTYANRFSIEFKVLFFRMMMLQHPELRHDPQFIKGMATVQQHLNAPTALV